MSTQRRRAFQLVIDNLFWVFVALIIILGTVLHKPFIAVSTGG